MMPFFLRHYSQWADKIVVWDERSTDGTREAVKACPKAELREWPFQGLNDDRFKEAQNEWWKPERALWDFILWPDVDELLHHPNMREVLELRHRQGYSLIPSRGYAMVPESPPADDGKSQFYELCKLGMKTPNYDKTLIFDPQKEVVWDCGRHVILRHNGVLFPDPEVRLFHCHFLGPRYTEVRNKRNYDRAPVKGFAWNYAEEHNRPDVPGTKRWINAVLRDQKAFDVVSNGWSRPLEKRWTL